MINWLKEWWETFWVWWYCDPETWNILTQKGHDPDDYVEVERP